MSADSESLPPPNEPVAFESLCLDMWQEILGGPTVYKHGRRGERQDGVDLYADCGGKWIGIQCKQKGGLLRSKLTLPELKREVEAARRFTPQLSGFVLATSGPAERKIQEAARVITEQNRTEGRFTVEIWDWTRIWHEIHQRKDLYARVLGTYWPALVDAARTGKKSALSSELQSLARRVFVIGGESGETAWPEAEKSLLRQACRDLGKTLAAAGSELVVCSPFPDSVDFETSLGYAEHENACTIHFHCPDHPDVRTTLDNLKSAMSVESHRFHVQSWWHPGYEKTEERGQAWLYSQIRALENADIVVAIGGRLTKSANTLLRLAEFGRIPLLPFTFMKGAAERAFWRCPWATLHPGFDTELLKSKKGLVQVVSLANHLIRDAVRVVSPSSRPRKMFLSRAKQDASIASEVVHGLAMASLDVVLGDDVTHAAEEILVSIHNQILACDVCAILWSRSYALSPHCHDELRLAIDQQMVIWLFVLDATPVIPKEARRILAMHVKGANGVIAEVSALLSGYERAAT